MSEEPVTIITAGSLRDVTAANNRNKDLFREKVGKLLIFIGEASAGTVEWNVGLDPLAFRIIMNSGLPVWWVPCFDGGNFKNNGNASYWNAEHRELLQYASPGIMNFFIYALLKKDSPGIFEFLDSPVNETVKEQILDLRRNLWCTAVFTVAAGRKIVKKYNEYIALPEEQIRKDDTVVEAFRFIPVSLYVNEDVKVVYKELSGSKPVLRYQVVDKELYPEIKTSVTANLFKYFAK